MKRPSILIFLLYVSSISYGQVKTYHDPDSVKFITTDIDRYWNMYHHLYRVKTTEDSTTIIQKEYLDNASAVLRDRMNEKNGITATGFFWGFRSFPKYIASIENSTRKIKNFKPVILKDFRKLKSLYPQAVFPDYYFVIGDFNSGGRPLPNGMFIGAEITAADENSPLDEFKNFPGLKHGIATVDQITIYCCHELIHRQQKGTANSLLAYSINEGAADFVAEKISGIPPNKYQHQYGDAHEKELWLMFRKDTSTNNYNHWLYNSSVKDIPKDMGYFIGYKICEAYYNKATDKKQAIKEILEVTDYEAFLKKSGYGLNFEQ